MDELTSIILRASAYWTNVQRALGISVLIFGLRPFRGHKNAGSCFRIGQVDGNIFILTTRVVVRRVADLRRRSTARATSCSSCSLKTKPVRDAADDVKFVPTAILTYSPQSESQESRWRRKQSSE